MTYICFIESSRSSVPYMEPLSADDVGTAVEKAGRLMAEHSSAIAAHVFYGEERIATLIAKAESSSASPRLARRRPSGARRPA